MEEGTHSGTEKKSIILFLFFFWSVKSSKSGLLCREGELKMWLLRWAKGNPLSILVRAFS